MNKKNNMIKFLSFLIAFAMVFSIFSPTLKVLAAPMEAADVEIEALDFDEVDEAVDLADVQEIDEVFEEELPFSDPVVIIPPPGHTFITEPGQPDVLPIVATDGPVMLVGAAGSAPVTFGIVGGMSPYLTLVQMGAEIAMITPVVGAATEDRIVLLTASAPGFETTTLVVRISPSPILILTPNVVNINNTTTPDFRGTSTASGTGAITLDTSGLPAGVTATANNTTGVITVTGVPQATAINGTFTIVVTRGGLTANLTVNVNMPIAPPTPATSIVMETLYLVEGLQGITQASDFWNDVLDAFDLQAWVNNPDNIAQILPVPTTDTIDPNSWDWGNGGANVDIIGPLLGSDIITFHSSTESGPPPVAYIEDTVSFDSTGLNTGSIVVEVMTEWNVDGNPINVIIPVRILEYTVEASELIIVHPDDLGDPPIDIDEITHAHALFTDADNRVPIERGSSRALYAAFLNEDGNFLHIDGLNPDVTAADVLIISSASSIANVDNTDITIDDGRIIFTIVGHALGTAEITVFAGGLFARVYVEITRAPVRQITAYAPGVTPVSVDELVGTTPNNHIVGSINLGPQFYRSTHQFTARLWSDFVTNTLAPDFNVADVTWTSSMPDVLEIDDNGLATVTSRFPFSMPTIITVTAPPGSMAPPATAPVTATFIVWVSSIMPHPAINVHADPMEITLIEGDEGFLEELFNIVLTQSPLTPVDADGNPINPDTIARFNWTTFVETLPADPGSDDYWTMIFPTILG